MQWPAYNIDVTNDYAWNLSNVRSNKLMVMFTEDYTNNYIDYVGIAYSWYVPFYTTNQSETNAITERDRNTAGLPNGGYRLPNGNYNPTGGYYNTSTNTPSPVSVETWDFTKDYLYSPNSTFATNDFPNSLDTITDVYLVVWFHADDYINGTVYTGGIPPYYLVKYMNGTMPEGYLSYCTDYPAIGNTTNPRSHGTWIDGPIHYFTPAGTNQSGFIEWHISTTFTQAMIMSHNSFRVMFTFTNNASVTSIDYVGIRYVYTSQINTDLNVQIGGYLWLFVLFIPAGIIGGGIATFSRAGAIMVFAMAIIGMSLIVYLIDNTFMVFMIIISIGGVVTFYKGVGLLNTGLFSICSGLCVLIWTGVFPAYSIVLILLIFAGMVFMESGTPEGEIG
jgi:hypothetical protein